MRDLEHTNSEIITDSSKSIYLNSKTKRVNITCAKAEYFDGSISVFINKIKIEAKCGQYKPSVDSVDFYCVSKYFFHYL